NTEVSGDLVAPILVINGDSDAARVLYDPPNDSTEVNPTFQRFCDARRQQIVAAGNARELVISGILVFSELIDDGDERQVFWIGQEEASQPAHAGDEERVRVDVAQPVAHRSPGDVQSNCGVPAPARHQVIVNLRLQVSRDLSPCSRSAMEA